MKELIRIIFGDKSEDNGYEFQELDGKITVIYYLNGDFEVKFNRI